MTLPTMTPVTSSNITAIGYEPTDQYLYVRFKSGLYRHEEVPAAVHTDFMASESKGRFYSAEIKGKYPSAKIAEAAAGDSETTSSGEIG